jgi:lipoyl(octanoyl) transferase
MGMINTLIVKDFGTIEYTKAFDEQLKLHRERVDDNIRDTLLLLEHPHVFTLGRHATEENIVWNDSELNENDVIVKHVDRGGDVTYHGPGQIVGYPIIKLKDRDLRPRRLVEWVEGIIIRTLNYYDIDAYVHPDYPGVWVGDAKICAIGMRIREGVSYHGFALNVSTDLSYFNGIVPCGIQDKSVCSMESLLNRKIDIQEVKKIISKEAQSIL